MATQCLKSPFAHVRLSSSLKDDLRIWIEFFTSFNGHSVWHNALGLFTDASGAKGYGAYFQGQWSAEPWHKSWRASGITETLF